MYSVMMVCFSAVSKRDTYGSGDRKLSGPAGLTIDRFLNLVVCDSVNSGLQIFTLDGKRVSKIEGQAMVFMSHGKVLLI